MTGKIYPVPHTGLNNWAPTRPSISWQPFGNTNGALGKEPTYWAKHRDGSQTQIYNDMSSSDIEDNNPHGIWTADNAHSDNAYSHRVMHKKDHSTYMQLGWDSNANTNSIKQATNIAPITNFSGMSFWWDRKGSYWSDSAINIDKVFFTIYDGEADKVWQQKAEKSIVTGLDPELNGDNTAEWNKVYYKTSTNDWNWCSNNPRFLIGLTIQFFQKSEGGASHSRVFRIYNLQPIYGGSARPSNGARQLIMRESNQQAINTALNGGKQRPYLASV
jgi:hypothetical protein